MFLVGLVPSMILELYCYYFIREPDYFFLLVVVFHVLTKIIPNWGVPYVMIISSLIFFDASFHKRIVFWENVFIFLVLFENGKEKAQHFNALYKTKIVLSAALLRFNYCSFRYLCYPNELFWTEEGFRFSWRVMLMEKQDMLHLKLKMLLQKKSPSTVTFNHISRKQMAFQPDFILEYAHYLHDITNNKDLIIQKFT
jgi:hypothetical protein